MIRGLKRAQDGATAVEYGLIAGLLALGIIGSLVTTKTSLNSVFGSVSTQMATAQSAGSTNAALGARAPYWSAKTLSSTVNGVNGNGPYTTYTYSDGSYATLTKYTSGSVNTYLEVWDPAQPLRELYTIDANGVNNGIQVENHVVGANGALGAYQGHIYSQSISNGTISSAGCGGNGCYTGNLTYLQSEQSIVAADLQYFGGITPKIGG